MKDVQCAIHDSNGSLLTFGGGSARDHERAPFGAEFRMTLFDAAARAWYFAFAMMITMF